MTQSRTCTLGTLEGLQEEMNGNAAGNPVRHSPTCSYPDLHTTAARATPTLARAYLGEMRAEELCSELVGFLSIPYPSCSLLSHL